MWSVTTRLFQTHVFAAAGLSALVVSSVGAYAVSNRVKAACQDDYLHHCSAYEVGSESLRQCMRKVGGGLSTSCIAALVQEGEITEADIDRYSAGQIKGARASNAPKKDGNTQEPARSRKNNADNVAKGSANGAKSSNTSKPQKMASVGKSAPAEGTTAIKKPLKATKSDDKSKAVKPASKEKTARTNHAAKIRKSGKSSEATRVANNTMNRSKSAKASEVEKPRRGAEH
jgi:hypothetical protein